MKQWNHVLLFILLIVSVVGIVVYRDIVDAKNTQAIAHEVTMTVKEAGRTKTYIVTCEQGETLGAFSDDATRKPEIVLDKAGKVKMISGISNTANKTWQLWLNDKPAVGDLRQLVLQSGDELTFIFR